MKRARRPRYGMFVRALVPGVDRHGFVWEVFVHRTRDVLLRDIEATEAAAVEVAQLQLWYLGEGREPVHA